MHQHRIRLLTGFVLAAAVALLSSTGDAVRAQSNGADKGKVTRDETYVKKFKRVAPSEQRAAARRAAKLGLKPGIAGSTTGKASALDAQATGMAPAAVQVPAPGGVPHYFGPYGNWAFSPLPKGPVAIVTVVDGGTGYTNPTVAIDDAYLPASSITNPATVTASADATGAITGFTIGNPGDGYSAPVVTITDNPLLCGALGQPACGTGAIADAVIGGTLTGGIRKFVDSQAHPCRGQQPWPVHPGWGSRGVHV
jgi:hypothetical protein